MSGLTVRWRLTIWHSGLLALLVLAFAVASYVFLRSTELARIDTTLHEQSEIVMQVIGGAGGLPRRSSTDTLRIINSLHDLRAQGLRAWILDASNHPVYSTAMINEGEGVVEEQQVLGDTVSEALIQGTAAGASVAPVETTLPTPSGGVRLYAVALPRDIGPGSVVVTYSLYDLSGLLEQARRAAIIAVALAVLLSVIAGYVLARRSLAPVTAMSGRAAHIGATNLHERLPSANSNDELGVLATTFNALLDRVAVAFEQQRRFMADASHELRTPVAIMRGEAEVALASDDRTREEYRDALAIVRGASDRLTRTVNDVFLLARVDAGQVPAAPRPIYLDDVVGDTCHSMRSLAKARDIELVVSSPHDVPYVGDETLLERLVINLVDNAIKYAHAGTAVRVSLAVTPDAIVLSVTNNGEAIASDARAHVFERFYRADAARTHALASQGSGSGLGLSIARWIAELHGGTLDLTDSSPTATTFTLRLPLEPVLRVP